MKAFFAQIIADPSVIVYLMTAVITLQIWFVKRIHNIECLLSIIKDRLKIKE